MIAFDIQRFDSVEQGPKWIFQDENADGYQGETLYFIPAGKTYTVKQEQRWWYGMTVTANVPYPDGNETIIIAGNQYGKGLGSVPDPDTSTTITATLKANTAISDITVTGSDRHLLRMTIDGVEYMVGDDGHLVPPASPITANAWYALYSAQTTFGWLGADSTTQNDGYLDDNDSSVTVWITNLSAISGSANAASATLATGKTINDVAVSGSGASSLYITIGGIEYGVNANGKLYDTRQTASGAGWFYFNGANPYCGYIPAGSEIKYPRNTSLSTSHDNGTTVMQITSVSSVTGSTNAASATLATGKTINDVTVTGTGASGLTLTISSVEYFVSNNKLSQLYTTVNGAQWRATDSQWVYIPSGASATLNNKTGNLTSTNTTVLQISNVSNVSGNATAATATLSANLSDVTVTGSAISGLILTVNNLKYVVSGGKLVEKTFEISGAQWRNATPSGTATWVYLPENASASVNENTGDMVSTSTTILQVTNVESVTGSDNAASSTLAAGKTINDVVVSGSASNYVVFTIGGLRYVVDGGRLTDLTAPIAGAQWRNATPSSNPKWVYLPANESAAINENTGDMTSTSATTLQVSGVSNVTGDDSNATATLIANATAADVIVTGSAANSVTFTVEGVNYRVDENGRFIEIISGQAWYELSGGNGVWGWLSANSLTRVHGHLSNASDTNVAIWISGVNSVEGSANAASATLNAGKTIPDVTVTGSAASGLTLTISSVEYSVDANGKLVMQAVIMTGSRWINLQENTATYGVGFLPEGVTVRGAAENIWAGVRGEEDEAFTVIITGGALYRPPQFDSDNVIIELPAGSAASDVAVANAPMNLSVTVMEGVKYLVDVSGALVATAIAAAKTTLVNRIKKNGKMTSQEIGSINPKATDEQLSTFMNALNGLTTNVSAGIYRVSKHDI